ncbi:hypothetical protein DJ79_10535 [Halorubrum ezzemoulense]|uniref:Uncharacterized protein n=1 Tax=Halorubrum ezzemoulense TaxID=337243 RepID=A0A256JF37_HALEZ|nr:hypothetical protein DJ79_10535 [Halorubrum ezzemoulense]OYR75136.1 hypothetical protein DJ76_03945 [Halorubrum ezzemoulense]
MLLRTFSEQHRELFIRFNTALDFLKQSVIDWILLAEDFEQLLQQGKIIIDSPRNGRIWWILSEVIDVI